MFKTPPYWSVAIERPVKVQLELRRKSDKETSDPVEFTYQPQMFGKYVSHRFESKKKGVILSKETVVLCQCGSKC